MNFHKYRKAEEARIWMNKAHFIYNLFDLFMNSHYTNLIYIQIPIYCNPITWYKDGIGQFCIILCSIPMFF